MNATDSPASVLISPATIDVHTLIVGDWRPAEFAAALEQIHSSAASATIEDAYDLLASTEMPPEVVFVAQHLPGDITQPDVDRLQSAAPLARLVIVSGTWCEGELRTGSPPTGVIRLYWYELAPWWQAAMRKYRAGQCPLWSLPLDHPQAGRWSSDWTCPNVERRTDAIVEANDFGVYGTLSSALADYGITTTWYRERPADGDDSAGNYNAGNHNAGIWDGSQLSGDERERLAAFCKRVNGPVVALLDFPRREHFRLAKQLGAASVFGKPYVVEALIAAAGY
ncbi:MAG: hypothetical protein AAGD11_07020 [Planctomycetota bacterium]